MDSGEEMTSEYGYCDYGKGERNTLYGGDGSLFLHRQNESCVNWKSEDEGKPEEKTVTKPAFKTGQRVRFFGDPDKVTYRVTYLNNEYEDRIQTSYDLEAGEEAMEYVPERLLTLVKDAPAPGTVLVDRDGDYWFTLANG
jgi:hypothetical protein